MTLYSIGQKGVACR